VPRRSIVIKLALVAALAAWALALLSCLPKPVQVSNLVYWPTDGWRTSTPEEQGFDSGKLAEGLEAMRGMNLDSLLIIRNGHIVLDAYFYPYDNTIPHKLASVTKSFMTTLIGIAVDQGRLELDRPMVSFFPGRAIGELDARKERITVRHLASMRNGLESGCLQGDESTLDAMRAKSDWMQAALDRKMSSEPGTRFCYDSPGMHLLSAILQEATGMTTLEFARQYLFEPLGIHEVVWRSDPQGYTRGWGDLYLKPRDAAKLGHLWLNCGVWEGQQIMSAGWVEDSVKAQSRGATDGYGFGWWVSEDNYYAYGRGGQYIKVFPSLNAIVVTTASGLDFSQVEPLLMAAFVDPDKPLPANPAGVADLDAMLTAVAQAPSPWPARPLPELAGTISGKTYTFGPNAADLSTLKLESSDTVEATLYLRLEGNDETWPIGLDGRYRLSPGGQGLRGYWADERTFVIQVFEEGLSTLRLHFEDDRVEISSPERGLQFEGQIESPSTDTLEPAAPPGSASTDSAPTCPAPDGPGTVSPAVSVYSMVFEVNGVERIVREGDRLQARPGDELQVRQVTVCVASFSGNGGEACVDLTPVLEGGREVTSQHRGTHLVRVIPGLISIPWSEPGWTIGDDWSFVSAVVNHWPPQGTEDGDCANGRCERDDRMVIGLR